MVSVTRVVFILLILVSVISVTSALGDALEALYLMMSCRRMRGQWQAFCYLQVLDKLGFEGFGAGGLLRGLGMGGGNRAGNSGGGMGGMGGLGGAFGGLGAALGGLGQGMGRGMGRMGTMAAMMGEELEFEMFEL